MVLTVLSALELDEKSTKNKFTLIEENDTSDGSFIVSSFLEEAVKNKQKIVILLFHNSIGHYHAIAQKLGYNLLAYQERGNVIVYDFLKQILNGSSSDEDVLKNLFLDIRQNIIALQESSDVTVLIDNIGNLLLYGFQLNNAIFFVHYCNVLLHEHKNVSLVCLVHNFSDSDNFTVLLNHLRHKAYLNVIVDDLKTGKAVDVSGKFNVKWRNCDLMQWEQTNEYHFQLLDKNVNVFAPGSKYI